MQFLHFGMMPLLRAKVLNPNSDFTLKFGQKILFTVFLRFCRNSCRS